MNAQVSDSNGYNLFCTHGCEDCYFVKWSSHCVACINCEFCDQMLFCSGQKYKKLMAFNKPITEERYWELRKMYDGDIDCVERDAGLVEEIKGVLL